MAQRFKRSRLWLIIGLGVIPFTGLPMAAQVGLAVGVVVLLMALSSVARNPGTLGDSAGESGSEGFPHGPGPWGSTHATQVAHYATSREGAPSGHPSGGQGGGAADSGQAADGGGGDGGGGGGD